MYKRGPSFVWGDVDHKTPETAGQPEKLIKPEQVVALMDPGKSTEASPTPNNPKSLVERIAFLEKEVARLAMLVGA